MGGEDGTRKATGKSTALIHYAGIPEYGDRVWENLGFKGPSHQKHQLGDSEQGSCSPHAHSSSSQVKGLAAVTSDLTIGVSGPLWSLE